jgi:hypothetical protein
MQISTDKYSKAKIINYWLHMGAENSDNHKQANSLKPDKLQQMLLT